jgi:hypothetical protein
MSRDSPRLRCNPRTQGNEGGVYQRPLVTGNTGNTVVNGPVGLARKAKTPSPAVEVISITPR